MKKTPCYADLDEFWIVGDFVANVFMGWGNVFMGWGGECHQCYIDFGDPARAERFSSYREARKFMKSDEDAAKWVKDHGGGWSVKPLRCRKSVVVYPPGRRP